MKKPFLLSVLITAIILLPCTLLSQSSLTIEEIMQGEKFTGVSPDRMRWSPSGERLYFNWTQDVDSTPSLYAAEADNPVPRKLSSEEIKKLPSSNGTYNRSRSKMVFEKNGDIFILDIKTGAVKQITSTLTVESNPLFNLNEDKIIFTSANNLYSWDINKGIYEQLCDFRSGTEKPEEKPYSNDQDKFLYYSQLQLFKTLSEREKESAREKKESKEMEPERPKAIYTGKGQVRSAVMSPDGNYLLWQTIQMPDQHRTIVPSYVTLSGYTEDINSRTKVGQDYFIPGDLNILDISGDTIYSINKDDIPGIADLPDYVADYPEKEKGEPEKRDIMIRDIVWSEDGANAVLDIYSMDNKDRWIMLLDIKTGGLKLLDRQHDDAWIGGPGIGYGQLGWLPDNTTIFFQSEETGYSHLYSLDITTGKKKALTSGKFEIYSPTLSNDKSTWYFISNETDPGIRELYSMPVKGGTRKRLTNFEGGVEYELSPDDKYFALRVSHANEPWDLYILENKNKSLPVRITESATEEFLSYNWRVPEYVRFKATDGEIVPARLYKPDNTVENGPAVVFVHGAGYLQNAHRWWSSYFREYMFHNFLVDNGYTVLDIDYRGSAGYGRDWRTAIYRHMGGKDLDDQVDGAKYLVEQCQVDPERIGIYGGSYGGFITLMAMFTKPGTFKAGAALRSVTDWAHYNHGYTSNILNTPAADSLAFVRSSPVYYAEGLEGALLMCHGMIDDNVHFQDIVRLTQRLIELGKDNWELAVYPLESHSFVEPSSWTDEYKRIFQLFEENLKE
jgi:dipeptidyl aminopeptidase/acylaminoacyl peptidase